MKRILLANKFFYPRGGDCVHTLNFMRLLQGKGHEVAVFSMDYPDNLPSEWQRYFAGEVRFSGGGGRLKALERIFGGAGVRAKFASLLDDFRPDVVHLQNIHSYLSPVLARMAAERGIPVFWTLHDYKLLCPAYSCLCGGKVCERCFHGKMPVLTSRCMKGSLAASLLAWLEAEYWSRKKLERWVTAFVCPSAFMASKMRQGGFPEEKLKVLCNFIPAEYAESLPEAAGNGSGEREEAYCYVGRLSAEKGVETLLKVASGLPYKLYVAGDGPLLSRLREEYASAPQIVWLGRISAGEVRSLLGRVRFSVLPSECYDNNPLSAIESFCSGTPLLGARIGGIPELIEEGVTGMTFEAGNQKELKEKIIYLFAHRLENSNRIRESALERFSQEAYYRKMMTLYDAALRG